MSRRMQGRLCQLKLGFEAMKGNTMPGMWELIVIMSILPIVIVLNVLPFWKICTKAGFSGALSLLILVPIANIVFLFYLAFAEWPALRDSQGHTP